MQPADTFQWFELEMVSDGDIKLQIALSSKSFPKD